MTFIVNENGVVYQRIWARRPMFWSKRCGGYGQLPRCNDGGLLWNYQEQ